MSDRDRVDEIFGRWREDCDRGASVDPDDVIREHPELAEELRKRFAAMRDFDRVFGGTARGEDAPKQVGDYRIVREIGRGGMGVVYEAQDTKMDRRVALKVLAGSIVGTGEAIRRFRREARAAGRLHHTNIVPIYGMDQHEGRWYYAMELVEGQSLSSLIADLAGLGEAPAEESLARISASAPEAPAEERRSPSTYTGDRAYYVRVAEMFAGVAEALQLAHDQGIVHRDVKPANLLVAPDGRLKLVDFGLARLDGDAANMTLTGALLGTPAYMSPEQAMAKRMDLDHRTDVYSLGATLYEVLTLRRPFDGKSLQELCSQIITKDPVLPRRTNRKIPKDLETIVLKAMEKDRERRYDTAGAMSRDLRLFAEGGAIRARRIGVTGRAWRKVKRHKVRSALAVAVLLLVGAATLFAWHASRESAQRRALQYDEICARARSHLALGPAESGLDPDRDGPAAELFARAIELMPERPGAYLGRALALAHRRDSGALEDAQAALDRGIDPRTAHLLRAWIFRKRGEPAEAMQEEQRAALLGPGDATADFLEGLLLLDAGRREESREALARAINRAPRGSPIRFMALRLRGVARVLDRDLAGALEDFGSVTAAGDDSMGVRLTIARTHALAGGRGKRDAILERLVQEARARGDEEAWVALCTALYERRFLDWLGRVGAEGLEAFPESPDLLALAAQGIARLRPADALDLCDRGLALEPDHLELLDARAYALRRLRRYPEALAAIDHYLSLDPTDKWGLLGRAAILNNSGELDEALAVCDRVLADHPYVGWAHTLRAYVLIQLGRPEEALAAADVAVHLNPYTAETHHGRAAALKKLGRRQEAEEELDSSVELLPDNVNVRLNRARLRMDLGQLEEALTDLALALEQEPGNADALAARTQVFMDQKRWPEALADARRRLEVDPESSDGHVKLGYILFHGQDKSEEGLHALDRALDLDAGNANAWRNRANILLHTKRAQEALETARRAVELEPDHAPHHVTLGMTLQRTGRSTDALRAFERAIELDPGQAEAYAHRGFLLMEMGRPDEALQSCNRAVELDPGKATTHGNRGCVLAMLGRNEEALKALDRAFEIGPSTATMHCNRALVLDRLGRLEEALTASKLSIELDPEVANAHLIRGDVLRHLERYAESLVAYERATDLAPRVAVHHMNRGNALLMLERRKEALAAYEHASELQPEFALPHYNRGYVYFDMGNYEEALKAYDRSIALDPKSAATHSNRGDSLRFLGRFKEALEAYDSAIAIDPTDGDGHDTRRLTLSTRGALREVTGDFEGALRDARALEGLGDTSFRLRVNIPRLCKLAGNTEHAAGLFARLLGELDSEDAWYAVAMQLYAMRDGPWALETVRQGLEENPDSVELLLLYANCCRIVGANFEGALEKVLHAWRVAPGPRTGAMRAAWLLRSGREAEAHQAWVETKRLGPTPASWTTWAGALEDMAFYDQALEASREAALALPDSTAVLRLYGGKLNNHSRFAEGLAVLDRCLQLDPADVEAHAFRAVALQQLGRDEEALTAADRALALDPASSRAWAYRSVIHVNQRRHEEALRDADRALALDGRCALAHSMRGAALSNLGRREEALAAHRAAVAAEPLNQAFRSNMVMSHLGSGKYGEALACANEALGLLRKNAAPPAGILAMALNQRGVALANLNRMEEALDCFDEAVSLLADSPRTGLRLQYLLNRGITFNKLGRTPEAERDYRRILELDPANGSALNNLMNIVGRAKRWKELLEVCERGIKHHPDNEFFYINAGVAAAEMGREDYAIRLLEAGVKRFPGHPGLANNLAWRLITSPTQDRRDPARALELLRSVKAPDSKEWRIQGTLCLALYRNGEFGGAVKAAHRQRELGGAADPVGGAYSALVLAMAHKMQGDQEQAREWYDKALAWIGEHKPDDEVLKDLRAEAAELLGVEK